MTPELWPEVKLKFQRRRDFQEYAKESTTNTFEFSARKDIYDLRLEYNFKREEIDNALPTRDGSAETTVVRQGDLQGNSLGRDGVRTRPTRSTKRTRTNRAGASLPGRRRPTPRLLKTRLKNSLVHRARG